MAYRREELRREHILSADELKDYPHGRFVRAAACVIARQRPGTPHGFIFIFISMEDETGIANVIVTPDPYERGRMVVTHSKFIFAEGPLQNQDGVIHVKATRLQPLAAQRSSLQEWTWSMRIQRQDASIEMSVPAWMKNARMRQNFAEVTNLQNSSQ
jgi:DNA polymerase III alpha subunit